jgi:hypothetical protein
MSMLRETCSAGSVQHVATARRATNVRAAVTRATAVALIAVLFAACGPQRPAAPLHSPVPVAVSATLDLIPLDVSPDGEARLLVRLHYTDAAGRRAHVPPGGHVDVAASRGEVQWQPRVRYGDPAAIVRLTEVGPLALHVTSDLPRLPHTLAATTDTRGWRLAPVAARALGPHVVVIGWFPRVGDGTVRINRTAADGTHIEFADPAPASSFRDTTVLPAAHYTYSVLRPGADPIDVGVDVPADIPPSSSDVIRGKAMWLAFDDVAKWNVDTMLDRAQTAGLSAIELRMCYGEFNEVTPARRSTIDRFIDGAARRNIAIVAWTVPRAVTFEDLAADVSAAAYRTAAGNGVRGLAVDLERGGDFLGTGDGARTALATDIARLREALGPRVLIVATVEDPHLENLTDADVPYADIAADADVLQPMVYWRARAAGASIPGMRAQLQASYAALRRFVGPTIPIDIGGQTAALDDRLGAPPPAEVAASIGVAAQLGAIGETFFDWDATTRAQWAALAATSFDATPATAEPAATAPPTL